MNITLIRNKLSVIISSMSKPNIKLKKVNVSVMKTKAILNAESNLDLSDKYSSE